MKVKIGNNYFETLDVPLESIPAPSLFLIYINDLPNYIKSEIKLFADDVKLLVWSLSKQIRQNVIFGRYLEIKI